MASKLVNVRTLDQLAKVMPAPADADRDAMQAVLDQFPVRITRHLLDLMQRSPAVAAQFLPDTREVTTLGQDKCFSGLLELDVPGLERMYPDRVIIMPHHACPAYCRFCFRKFYEHHSGSTMSYDDLDRALGYVAARPEIREVLITGGEPVMEPKRLRHLLAGLRRIAHVGPIRLACRSLIMAPELCDDALLEMLAAHQDLAAGKPLEVALHANHPDEITAPTIERLVALRQRGIHVYNQTVLLRGINDDAEILRALFEALRRYGVETYYMFLGGPVRGMDHQRPTIADGLALKRALRRHASGRANPHFIVTTRLGKVEIGVDGEIVAREADGRHVWIRTPYTLAGFRAVSPRFELPDDARLDDAGYIVMRYLDGPSEES
ncbi:MAG: radical SAM protein [Myxococcales bacterium]|nr:radical SAM protein [Myxococcales bacterium]